jgi:hypothetical protein
VCLALAGPGAAAQEGALWDPIPETLYELIQQDYLLADVELVAGGAAARYNLSLIDRGEAAYGTAEAVGPDGPEGTRLSIYYFLERDYDLVRCIEDVGSGIACYRLRPSP